MKNLKALILLFSANIVSGIAQGISMISVPWYFGQQGEIAQFAVLFLVVNMISLFWVPYSGTLVDRFDRKRLFLVIILISGLCIFGISFLGYFNSGLSLLPVGLVFAITFLNFNIHYPTLYAFLQEITEQKYYGRISSFIEVQGQFSTILSGAVAAILLEGVQDGNLVVFGMEVPVGWNFSAWEIHEIFMLDACTYVLAFILIGAIRYVKLVQRHDEYGGFMKRLKIGYNYLKENPIIFLFGVGSYSVFVTMLISLFYLYAPYVSDVLQEGGDTYANMDMFYGLGAIVAGLGIRYLLRGVRLVKAVLILTGVMGLAFFTLASTKWVALFFAVILIQGICNAGTRVLRVSYLFKYIPNQVYGRASSIYSMTNIGWRILFLALFSLSYYQGEQGILRSLYVLGGFLIATLMILLVFYPRFQKDLVKEF